MLQNTELKRLSRVMEDLLFEMPNLDSLNIGKEQENVS